MEFVSEITSYMARMVGIVCLLAVSLSWSEEQDRTFTDVKGRTLTGQVIAYDSEGQVVTIRRTDGRTANLPEALLCESDLKYVQDWAFEKDFMENFQISAQLQTVEVSSKETGYFDASKVVFDSWYELRFTNHSGTDFGAEALEYCIFYQQGEHDGGTVNYDEGILHGKIAIDNLKRGSTNPQKTRIVRLYVENGRDSLFGRVGVSDANIRGIWIRLKAHLPSGKEIDREYRTSADRFWKWSSFSIKAGLNEGATANTPMVLFQ